jgi:uncharacterized membrane protein
MDLRGLIIAFLLLAPGAVYCAGDPDTVDVLFLCGNSWNIGGYRRDILIRADPAIEVLAVQTVAPFQIWAGTVKPGQVNRKLRIYMPRNYEQLIEEHDIVVLHDVCHAHPLEAGVLFDRKWINWFVEGVEEEGLAVSMWGGDCCWGGHGEQDNPSWEETTLVKVLPFDPIWGYHPPTFTGIYMRPRFVDFNHPLKRLPWDEAPGIGVLNAVSLRQGAELVAEAESRNTRYPWIAWWDYEKGRVVGETQVFDSLRAGDRMRREWDWWQDFVIYLTYFGAGREIPEDVYRAHRLRNEINTHIAKKSMLVSVLEFVERFGASTVILYGELDQIDDLEKVAEDLYRRNEYDEASETFDEVHLAWNELNTKAIKLKDNALAWIYLIEWLVVSGASMVTGLVVWSLMIRRRYYRGVRTTRFS